MRTLVLVNRCNSTTIPIDIAARVSAADSVDLTIASFYESQINRDLKTQLPADVDTLCLDANGRFDVSAYRKLRRYLSNNRFDVLHTHHNSVGSMARAATVGLDLCVVNTEHRNHRFFTPLQRLVNFPTFLFTDHIVSNSHETKNSFYWYEDLFARWGEHHVIYNGFDFEDVDIRSGKNHPDASPTIVTVGRLVPIKNHETILRAFRLVQERIPDSELVLVGDGEQRDQLEALAETLGIVDSVRFTGNISRDHVYELLAEADLFALASESEGFCVAAIEAMAHGVPVVVSDIPTLNEVVGEAGVFADPNDPSHFATTMKILLSDPDEWTRLSHLGSDRVRKRFPLDQTAKQYVEVYEECAADS